MTTARFLRLVVVASVCATIFLSERANAAIVITRAELNAGQLRLEGQGAQPNASISVDGAVRGTAGAGGLFRIQLATFSSPTCKVTVSDGVSSAAATLIGCTPAPLPPAPSSVIFGTSTAAGTGGAALSHQAVGTTGVGGSLAFVYNWGDASTSRDPATGFYSAGTGTSVVGATVTHAWLTAGTFTVTVTAVDDLGRSVVSGPLSVTIVAAAPPPPAPGPNDCNTGFDAGNTLATATPITLPVTCTGTKPAAD